MIKKLINAFYVVGMIMTLVGAVVYITGWPFSPYVYTIGATFFALAQINDSSCSTDVVIRRLRYQQLFGALLLVLTGVFMLTTHGNEWIISMTIGAFLELYTSLRISKEEEKLN